MKGETADELAGFVEAARAHVPGFGEMVAPAGAADLPCYAGKRRAAPVFLAAALAAREAGIPVLAHGPGRIAGRLSAGEALMAAGVRRARSLPEAQAILEGEGMAWLDIADACPPLARLLGLRPRLGVRSFANTVARLLNPMACSGQLNGVFHPPYVERMARVNALLGQPRSLVFMGAEGEPELYADRQKLAVWQQGEALMRVRPPEAGAPAYPREPAGRLLPAGWPAPPGDARSRAVMARMLEAFRLASRGTRPEGWRFSDPDESCEKSD
jgi:anthranilate phosphoribosyltransferase